MSPTDRGRLHGLLRGRAPGAAQAGRVGGGPGLRHGARQRRRRGVSLSVARRVRRHRPISAHTQPAQPDRLVPRGVRGGRGLLPPGLPPVARRRRVRACRARDRRRHARRAGATATGSPPCGGPTMCPQRPTPWSARCSGPRSRGRSGTRVSTRSSRRPGPTHPRCTGSCSSCRSCSPPPAAIGRPERHWPGTWPSVERKSTPAEIRGFSYQLRRWLDEGGVLPDPPDRPVGSRHHDLDRKLEVNLLTVAGRRSKEYPRIHGESRRRREALDAVRREQAGKDRDQLRQLLTASSSDARSRCGRLAMEVALDELTDL